MLKSKVFFGFLALSAVMYAGEGKVSAEIQTMNGKAGEYVYSPDNEGDKISYLDWKIKNVPILKLGYDYTVDNWEFSISGKKNISKNYRSAYMKDYDWFSQPDTSDPKDRDDKVAYRKFGSEAEAKAHKEKRPQDYVEEQEDGSYVAFYLPTDKDRWKLSNFSKNKNYVKNIMGLDLSVKYYLKKTEQFKFAPVLGLNYDKYDFYALSGEQLDYLPELGAAVVNPGNGRKTITYKQRFLSPYLGVLVNYSPNTKWDITFGLKGSAWGKARAVDRHLERGKMESVENYKNLKYLSSSLAVNYHWDEALTLKAGVEATKHFHSRKSSVRNTSEVGAVVTTKDSSGIKNQNISYSLGFEYKF